ncbi:hypothetical protein Hanom_Chr12g01070591 [Helianthus anomalus]
MPILLFILYQELATWNYLKHIFLCYVLKTCILAFAFALNFILNMLQVEDDDCYEMK